MSVHELEGARRLCIFGSREGVPAEVVEAFVASLPADIEVVVGAAPHKTGVDYIAERAARKRGLKVKRYPADWKRYGKAGGPIRNADMAMYAERGQGFRCKGERWDGSSNGTDDCELQFLKRGKPVKVWRVAA
jgi:hypothetical protein